LILRVSPAPANWCGGASGEIKKTFPLIAAVLTLDFGGRILIQFARRRSGSPFPCDAAEG
jgi:hypothetical protein